MQYGDSFRESMREVAAAIDTMFGERVLVIPTMTRPNYPPENVMSAAFETIAAFTWVSKLVFDDAKHSRTAGSGSFDVSLPIASRDPKFSFNVHTLPQPIMRGYRLQRCCDGTTWDVTNVKPDGVSRIVADVVQLGRQE